MEGREIEVAACLRSDITLVWLGRTSVAEEDAVLAVPRAFRDTRGAPVLLVGRGVVPPDITRLERAALLEFVVDRVDVLPEPFWAQEAARGKPAIALSADELNSYI